jgi:hypothetical protein
MHQWLVNHKSASSPDGLYACYKGKCKRASGHKAHFGEESGSSLRHRFPFSRQPRPNRTPVHEFPLPRDNVDDGEFVRHEAEDIGDV